jgi:hypothetical protein
VPASGLPGDVVRVIIGDLDWGPVEIPGGTYQATLPLDPVKNYAITVDYDVSTYDVAESSDIFIGPQWAFGGAEAPLLESDSGTLFFAVNGQDAFAVGMMNYGPEDFLVSFGTLTIRVAERQPEQSHDTQCDAEIPWAGIQSLPAGGNHRGEGTLSVPLTADTVLRYNSAGNPHPVLTAQYVVPTGLFGPEVPAEVRASLSINGQPYGNTVSYDTTALAAGDSFTATLQADVSGTHGFFDYEIVRRGTQRARLGTNRLCGHCEWGF